MLALHNTYVQDGDGVEGKGDGDGGASGSYSQGHCATSNSRGHQGGKEIWQEVVVVSL